jgi:hypothetical protein
MVRILLERFWVRLASAFRPLPLYTPSSRLLRQRSSVLKPLPADAAHQRMSPVAIGRTGLRIVHQEAYNVDRACWLSDVSAAR